MYGRNIQISDARRAIQGAAAIGFHARCGFGVSTLLRHIAASDFAQATGLPVARLRAGRGPVADVLQRLVDQLYVSEQRIRLTAPETAQVLGQLRAVVVLDDVAVSAEEAGYILAVLPRCSIVLGSLRPVFGRYGASQALPGLSEHASLELVTGILGRPPGTAEYLEAMRFVASVHGQPLRLKQAAALVRCDQRSFAELADSAQRDPAQLDRLCVSRMAEPERKILAIMTMAAGALIPAGLITVMAGVTHAAKALRQLADRGLAEQDQDRFGLPICSAARYRDILQENLEARSSARLLAGWLTGRDPGSPDAIAALDAALSLLEYAAERREWTAVIAIARAADPVLALAGR